MVDTPQKGSFKIIRQEKFKIWKTIEIQKKTEDALSKIHSEGIHKIHNVNWIQLQHSRQKTPANCWPLSIINWVYALDAFHEEFKYPEGFSRSSNQIRKLLEDNVEFRHASNWWYYLPNEVSKDNQALEWAIIYNIVNSIKWIRILWSGFLTGSNIKFIDTNNKDEMLNNADWIILLRDYHYKSYVKVNLDNWICVDSLIEKPFVLSDQRLKNTIGDIPQFLAMKYSKPQFTIKKI